MAPLCVAWGLQNPTTILKDQSHLIGLPELGGRNYHPMLERGVLGRKGSWARPGRGGVARDWGALVGAYICGESPFPFLSVSKMYSWFVAASLADLTVLLVSLIILGLFSLFSSNSSSFFYRPPVTSFLCIITLLLCSPFLLLLFSSGQ